jgi:TRAP-type C4-dicarboxylate transport system permease small subunit
MGAVRLYIRIVDKISFVSGRLVSVLMPLMMLVLAFEVVSRYAFNAPTLWAYDTAIFIFGYVGVIAGASLMRERAHINVDLLYARLPPRARAALDVGTGLVALFFLALVALYCWREGVGAIARGARRSTEWAPPVGHFILAIAVGAFLLALQTLANWLRALHLALTGRELAP